MAHVSVPAASPIEFPDAAVEALGSAFYGVFGPYLDGFEATFRAQLPDVSRSIDGFFERESNPYGRMLPLSNLYHALATVLLYFLGLLVFFIIGRLTGPWKLRSYGIAHNFVLTLWSLYMAVGVFWEASNEGMGWWNDNIQRNPAAYSMAKFCWLFYISKIPEFADTFIMMLKQNYRQVSFLHVYHHSSIFMIWAVALNLCPGGGCWFGVFQNSSVHVIMYTYYMLNLICTAPTSGVRKFLQRNKYYITYLQLLQFFLNTAQAVYSLFIAPVSFNAFCMSVHLAYMATMIVLFGNFLVKGKAAARRAPVVSGASLHPQAKVRAVASNRHFSIRSPP